MDGNDLFAVHEASCRAVERARAGEGPTLIESRTYRMGPHNTADDPTRYVDPQELEAHRSFDPNRRFRAYHQGAGGLEEGLEDPMRAEIEAEVEAALARAEAEPGPRFDQIFEHVYADPPSRLRRQWEDLADPAVGD